MLLKKLYKTATATESIFTVTQPIPSDDISGPMGTSIKCTTYKNNFHPNPSLSFTSQYINYSSSHSEVVSVPKVSFKGIP